MVYVNISPTLDVEAMPTASLVKKIATKYVRRITAKYVSSHSMAGTFVGEITFMAQAFQITIMIVQKEIVSISSTRGVEAMQIDLV